MLSSVSLEETIDNMSPSVEEMEEVIHMQDQQRVVRKPKGTTTRSIRRWLRRNVYNYTDVRQGIYINGHERKEVLTYVEEFVRALEDLWPFAVEFEDHGSMREKEYPPGCTVGGDRKPIIIIMHDE